MNSYDKMAYPMVLIATAMMWMQSEVLHNLIPGHSIISLLVSECGALLLTVWVMRLKLIGPAFSTLGCMFILSFIFWMVWSILKPDSIQYFILVTVIFSGISLYLCYCILTNEQVLFDVHIKRIDIPVLSWLVAGILNAFTASIFILTIRYAWEEFRFPEGDFAVEDKFLYNSFLGDLFGSPRGFASVPGAVVFYIVFTAVCLGAFVATFIKREDLP